jgi:hypothetical protein
MQHESACEALSQQAAGCPRPPSGHLHLVYSTTISPDPHLAFQRCGKVASRLGGFARLILGRILRWRPSRKPSLVLIVDNDKPLT